MLSTSLSLSSLLTTESEDAYKKVQSLSLKKINASDRDRIKQLIQTCSKEKLEAMGSSSKKTDLMYRHICFNKITNRIFTAVNKCRAPCFFYVLHKGKKIEALVWCEREFEEKAKGFSPPSPKSKQEESSAASC